MTTTKPRRSQEERRTKSRNALLQAAAQGIAKSGYTRLSLEDVARNAGYSRGALYHQFAGKEDLTLAVVEWFDQTWDTEVGYVLNEGSDPAEKLLALAREHALYCRRRDTAAILQVLRVEFTDPAHPIGQALAATIAKTESDIVQLIRAGRRQRTIPPGPPATHTAAAFGYALEAVSIGVGGHRPHDVELAERAARGILGLPPR